MFTDSVAGITKAGFGAAPLLGDGLPTKQRLKAAGCQRRQYAKDKTNAGLKQPCAVVAYPADGSGLLLFVAAGLKLSKAGRSNAVVSIEDDIQAVTHRPAIHQAIGDQIAVKREVNVAMCPRNLHRKTRRSSPPKQIQVLW